MSKHTMQELYQWQALPLGTKVLMTKERIRNWVDEYGVDGVYVSFSGGKDSTVLLHIAREMYGDDIKGVFVNTGLEYPEIVRFVKTFQNIDIIKPKMNFKQVIEKYGYPFIGKEVSGMVWGAKRWLTNHGYGAASLQTDRQKYLWAIADFMGFERRSPEGKKEYQALFGKAENIPEEVLRQANVRLKILLGKLEHKEKGELTSEYSKMYDKSRYAFLLKAPFEMSDMCCRVMKKNPMHEYQKSTGRNPMTAQMASESRLRTRNWLLYGCNGFDLRAPVSNPMAFWTEQDVLLYIKQHDLPIASVYGNVVVDDAAMNQCDGQMSFLDWEKTAEEAEMFNLDRPLLRTTGCDRTGCMFCGYGAHCRGDTRFVDMKTTHPTQYKWIMKPWSEGGLGYKDVIDWINEHGNLDIKY